MSNKKTFEEIYNGLSFHDPDKYPFREQHEGVLLFRATEIHSPFATQVRYEQASIQATVFDFSAINFYGHGISKHPAEDNYAVADLKDLPIAFFHLFKATPDQQFYQEFGAQRGWKTEKLNEISRFDFIRHHETIVTSSSQYIATHMLVEQKTEREPIKILRRWSFQRKARLDWMISDALTQSDMDALNQLRRKNSPRLQELNDPKGAEKLLRKSGFYKSGHKL